MHYESELREPLILGDKTHHQITEDVLRRGGITQPGQDHAGVKWRGVLLEDGSQGARVSRLGPFDQPALFFELSFGG